MDTSRTTDRAFKVLLASTSLDGGAGGAALRLHQGILSSGICSEVLTQRPAGTLRNEEGVRFLPTIHRPLDRFPGLSSIFDAVPALRRRLDSVPKLAYQNRDRRHLFSVGWLPDNLSKIVRTFKPDVVNLHWIKNGFLRYESIPKLKRPIVWTLHDIGVFTGGCDTANGGTCDRYKTGCGSCPILGSSRIGDLSRRIWKRKQSVLRKTESITLVSPSKWLADIGYSSEMFERASIHVIPNGIDRDTFYPYREKQTRKELGLSDELPLVLAGGGVANASKGLQILIDACYILNKSGSKFQLGVFGPVDLKVLQGANIPIKILGWISRPSQLARIYATADVFVAPSLQDNLPTTVLEALSCGTPAIGFKTGGIPEIIEHGECGFLAESKSAPDLAEAIHWVLDQRDRKYVMRERARLRSQEYDIKLQVNRYLELFENVVSRCRENGE